MRGMDGKDENMEKSTHDTAALRKAGPEGRGAYLMRIADERMRYIGTWRIVGGSGWRLYAHKHTFHELLYFAQGNTTVNVGRSRVVFSPYDMILYPPSVTHHEYPNFQGDRHDVICVHFDVGSTLCRHGPIIAVDRDGHLRWLFERLLEEIQDEPGRGRAVSCDLIRVILRLTAKATESPDEKRNRIVNLAMLHIQNNVGAPIDVAGIARAVGTSPAYLSRRFTKELGVSPTQYAISVKMENAKRKLALTNESIKEIASSLGYRDALYFSRLFRKGTGKSPRGFRRAAERPGPVGSRRTHPKKRAR
jgi:AraC-like DNA-binding protein